jgi:hypothetical protein
MLFAAGNRAASRLHEGMRLFHAGDRTRSIPLLETVLKVPGTAPGHSMAAAGLIAESYRGVSDYVRAAQYYELALAEGERMTPTERLRSEWYRHYRPRSVLGLVMVLRRQLSGDHKIIRGMLRALRLDSGTLGATDLPAQIELVTGLYERQLGDADSASTRLRRAAEDLSKEAPPHTFLGPDHALALLSQVEVLIPESRFSAGRRGDRVVQDALSNAWSRAAAAGVQLHIATNRVMRDGDAGKAKHKPVDDEAVQRALYTIKECATADGDPFLVTESSILHAAWAAIRGSVGIVEGEFERVVSALAALPHPPAPLTLLRAAEAAHICAAYLGGIENSPAARNLEQRARDGYRHVAAAATSYGLCIPAQDAALAPPGERGQFDWLDGPLRPLRLLAWP